MSDFEVQAANNLSPDDESEMQHEVVNMPKSVQLCQPISLTWKNLSVKIVKKKFCCKKSSSVGDDKFILNNGN